VNCAKPHIQNGGAFGCGHCVPCRIKKRREWTHRMMLEAAEHGDNSFITLTYDEENVPQDLSVSPYILSGFVKRLRKNTKAKFRYFGCGEYGDASGRPHYHLALFGFPACLYGRTRHLYVHCCEPCAAIKKAWPNGRTESGLLTPHSMAYVAGYLNKKMTRDTDPRLEGRRPEFARMSLRPALGTGMMHELASTLMEYGLDAATDVPVVLQHGTKQLPLGRTLRRKLRQLLGRDPNTPQETLQKYAQKLLPMRKAAFDKSISFKTEILENSAQRRRQIEIRSQIFKQGKSI